MGAFMEQDNMTYIADFNGVRQYEEIHKALKDGLDFPNYYGENLDALWDCLTETVGNNVKIILKNYQYVEKANEEYASQIIEVFKDAKVFADKLYTGTIIVVDRDGVETEIE